MEVKKYFEKVNSILQKIDERDVNEIVELLFEGYLAGKRVFIIGNGGSADNANHFAEDLCKGTSENFSVPGLKAISLSSHISFITALANDEGYERVFDRQLSVLAEPGDILIAISCSGNSPNIIRAAKYAKKHSMKIIGVCAFSGGKLKKMSDKCLFISVNDFGLSEALHLLLFHYIVTALREKIRISLENLV